MQNWLLTRIEQGRSAGANEVKGLALQSAECPIKRWCCGVSATIGPAAGPPIPTPPPSTPWAPWPAGGASRVGRDRGRGAPGSYSRVSAWPAARPTPEQLRIEARSLHSPTPPTGPRLSPLVLFAAVAILFPS